MPAEALLDQDDLGAVTRLIVVPPGLVVSVDG